MKKTLLVLILTFSLFGACTASVGDSCEINTDCGRSMVCEHSLPEGYCTRANCDVVDCPDDGICITFNLDVSFCMRPCEEDTDCRDGYACAMTFGSHPFCNDALGVAPP